MKSGSVKAWSSDDMGISQYQRLKRARADLSEVLSDVVFMANASNNTEIQMYKRMIREKVGHAIKSIDDSLRASTMKFYK